MAGDVTRVVAGRNVVVYEAPWVSTNAIPDNTVNWGMAWSAPWVPLGYTQKGVEFGMSVNRADITVDQELDPVLRPITARGVTLKTTLAEFSAANLKRATGQGTITTLAPAAGVRGYDDFDLSATVSDIYSSYGLDVLNPGDNEAIRVAAWRCLATGGLTTTFGVADANAQIPLELTVLPDSSTTPSRTVKVRDIIAAL